MSAREPRPDGPCVQDDGHPREPGCRPDQPRVRWRARLGLVHTPGAGHDRPRRQRVCESERTASALAALPPEIVATEDDRVLLAGDGRPGCGGRTLQSTCSSTRRVHEQVATRVRLEPFAGGSCHSWRVRTSPSSRRSSTAPKTKPTSKPWWRPGRSTCRRWLECSRASWEPTTTASSICCRSVDDRALHRSARYAVIEWCC